MIFEYDVDSTARDHSRVMTESCDDAISCDRKHSRIYVGSLEPWNALLCFFLWSTWRVVKISLFLFVGELLNSVTAGQVT